MTTLYVVMGSSGEYSDRSEWMVAAYADQPKAQEHVARVTRALAEFRAQRPDDGSGSALDLHSHPLDPVVGFRSYSDHDRYRVDTVELLDEVPA